MSELEIYLWYHPPLEFGKLMMTKYQREFLENIKKHVKKYKSALILEHANVYNEREIIEDLLTEYLRKGKLPECDRSVDLIEYTINKKGEINAYPLKIRPNKIINKIIDAFLLDLFVGSETKVVLEPYLNEKYFEIEGYFKSIREVTQRFKNDMFPKNEDEFYFTSLFFPFLDGTPHPNYKDVESIYSYIHIYYRDNAVIKYAKNLLNKFPKVAIIFGITHLGNYNSIKMKIKTQRGEEEIKPRRYSKLISRFYKEGIKPEKLSDHELSELKIENDTSYEIKYYIDKHALININYLLLSHVAERVENKINENQEFIICKEKIREGYEKDFRENKIPKNKITECLKGNIVKEIQNILKSYGIRFSESDNL